MTTFKELELENFKAYKNQIRFVWRQISSIVGLNGVGKSNILDALEFAFCFPDYNRISVQRLKKKICTKNGDDYYDDLRTTVKVTLINVGAEIVFQRSVDYNESVCIYSINGTDVSEKNYKRNLLEYNINYKANSFIVKQNSIESIATQNAKERCELFERLCGSSSFKNQYESLKKELNKIESEVLILNTDLKSYSRQKAIHSKSFKELQKCDKLQQELDKIQFEYYFIQIYQIDRTINDLFKEENNARKEIKDAQKEEESTKKSIEKLTESLKEFENCLTESEDETIASIIKEHSTKMLKVEQEISCCKDTIRKVEAKLDKARNAEEAKKKTIEKLRQEYNEVELLKENYVKSQSQLGSLQLEEKQYDEYVTLKSEAQKKFAIEISLYDSIERERDRIKDRINEHEMDMNFHSKELERKEIELKKLRLDINKLDEKIECTENSQRETIVAKEQLKSEINEKMDLVQALELDVENLDKQISENYELQKNDRQSQRKEEILKRLKYHFKGVIDRLINLCDITEERYKVAITKIMGKHMNDIVVVDRPTAINCIRFLKSQYANDKFSAVETFQPLDNIKPKSLDFVRRILSSKPKAKLALDVMAVNSMMAEDIRRVLQHIFNNVVICETDDEASDLSKRENLNCVSLNGTYYKRDGTFSGGLVSLLKKSKQWNMKERENLKEERMNKAQNLKSLKKEIHERQERYNELNVKLLGLNERLNTYLKSLYMDETKKLECKEQEFAENKKKLNALQTDPKIEELQQLLNEKNIELEKLDIQKNKIEDEVFEDFCKRFNINNIRLYKQRGFTKYKEYSEHKKKFDDFLDKINNEIKAAESLETKTTVDNLIRHLDELKDLLIKKQNKLKTLIEKNKSLFKKEDEIKSLKKEIAKIQTELKKENYKCKLKQRAIKECNSIVSASCAKISRLKDQKVQLYLDCKLKNIDLNPVILKMGTSTETETSDDTSHHSSESTMKLNDLELDYSKLPRERKRLGEEGLNNQIESLKNEQKILIEKLQSIRGGSKLNEDLYLEATEKLKALKSDYDDKVKELDMKKKEFEEVKNRRCSTFNEFFTAIEKKIDEIFKILYRDSAAQANIYMKNPDEPYLDGIYFHGIIPTKRFLPIENLSGGEKTMCAIALLVAIHSVKPAPALIFDEIDAALDSTRIKRIAQYFLKLKTSAQIIIISHHESLSACGDALIGIHTDFRLNTSNAIHFDLSRYRQMSQEDNSPEVTLPSIALEETT